MTEKRDVVYQVGAENRELSHAIDRPPVAYQFNGAGICGITTERGPFLDKPVEGTELCGSCERILNPDKPADKPVAKEDKKDV